MWLTPEQIEKAKQMDLLTYLQSYEPGNLKKISHDTWCTKEHDSPKDLKRQMALVFSAYRRKNSS